MHCFYGCGKPALFTFKNGKGCCSTVRAKCEAVRKETSIRLTTKDLVTGLTPLETGIEKMKKTIDPVTGLSLFDLKTQNMKRAINTTNPVTGLTPRQKADQKYQEIDPETGLSKRQLAALKANLKLDDIDPKSGKTKRQLKGEISSVRQKSMTKEKKKAKAEKIKISMNQIDEATGLTKKQLAALKTSATKTKIDPETGLSIAQQTAIKNSQNQNWLKNNTRGRASKQSLKIFGPLKELLKSLNLKIYVGDKDGREYFLHDHQNKCIRFYDFCLPELKIIVEFHGERYHPNPQTLTKEEWESWYSPYTKTSADEVRSVDIIKEKIALEAGFEYHIIWSSHDTQDATNKLYKIIFEKYLTYKANSSEM
jgi:hypothetical protein